MLADQMDFTVEQSPLVNLAEPNSDLGRTLMFMIEKVQDKHISIKDLRLIADRLQSLVGLKRGRYLLSLANPWKHKSARIPALINPPSATFTVRGIVPLTTNATGNVAFTLNPFFIGAPTQGYTGLTINNNVALTGTASSNFFTGVPTGQELPAAFYVKFRLVSAGLRLYCYPSSNNDNGIATVGVTFESMPIIGNGSILTAAAQFGDFNQIENCYFKETTTIASRNVQEHNYIPIDESFFDYLDVGVNKNGFAWLGYIAGAQPSTTIARLEFVLNFEALLDNQYTDYLPSDTAEQDVDPRNIPVIVNNLKNLDVLKPKNIEDVLRDNDVKLSDSDILNFPTPPKEKKKIESQIKNEINDMSEALRDFFPTIPKQKQPSIISDVMDFINPIASSVIQSVASKYMPMFPTLLKL